MTIIDTDKTSNQRSKRKCLCCGDMLKNADVGSMSHNYRICKWCYVNCNHKQASVARRVVPITDISTAGIDDLSNPHGN